MSSLVCYDSSSSDDEDCQVQASNPDLLIINDPASSNSISNNIHISPNEFELVECIDSSSNLKNDFENQETILDSNHKNISDSSTIVNIEESGNLSSLNDKEADIDIVLDTNPSEPHKITETYRHCEIINISIDSEDDSSLSSSCILSGDEDSSSSSSESDSAETFSVSDECSDSETKDSSGKKVYNNKNQTNSINSELCNYCLHLENNSSSETGRPIYGNQSLSVTPSTQDVASIDNVLSAIDLENSNMDTCDNNQEINVGDIENVENSQNSKQRDESNESIENIVSKESISEDNEITFDTNNEMRMICTCGKNKKENVEKKQKQKPKKKTMPSYYDEIELPPIEDLHISVEENEAKPIGTILHTVGNLVVVKTYQGIPAINLDSVLFLDQGKRSLGLVADVFGSIYEPHYVVRFNSPEHIKEMEIEKEEIVYFAPQTEHTSFVILDELINMKGSDASWRDNTEPPEHCLDYSDDEEERIAKQVLKAKKKERNQANGEITIVKEFESQRKKPRSERPNPFSSTNYRGKSSNQPRYVAPSQFNMNTRNSFQRNQNNRSDDEWRNVRFGGPPNIRSGMQSPFIPPPSPSPSVSEGTFFNSYASPSPSPSENYEWHRFAPPHSPSGGFPLMARPSTPLPPQSFPYNNCQSFSPSMNSFNTPPPPPPSPVHINQPNLHIPSHTAADFSQTMQNPPPIINNNLLNNTLGPTQSWQHSSQNHTSFGTYNNTNPPFSSQNYFQSPNSNFLNVHAGFQPNTQTPPLYQSNPSPTMPYSNIYNPLPSVGNQLPLVSPNTRMPPPPFNQTPFQGIPPHVPPPHPQSSYQNIPPNF